MAKTRVELESEGWREASVTSGGQLERVLAMYRELGIEVHLEEVAPEECDGCTECFQGGETIYRLYTRSGVT